MLVDIAWFIVGVGVGIAISASVYYFKRDSFR